jgi:hypothetical protein
MALYYFHGPLWLVDMVSAVALILLVAWKPGASPNAKCAVITP